MPFARRLQLIDGNRRLALNHSRHRAQVGFRHRTHGLRFGDAGAQLAAPDRQADADHRHPAAPLSHRVRGAGADRGHRAKHVPHHLHVRLGTHDFGSARCQFRTRRQRGFEHGPRGHWLRERERRERRHRKIGVPRHGGVEHGLCGSNLARERALQRLQPCDLHFGPEHIRLRRRAARISGVCRVDDIPGKRDLLVDEYRRTSPLLEHQVGVRCVDSHIERRASRFGPQAIDVSEGGCASMTANAGERNLLLDRDADVGPAQHERQVVEGRRNHGVLECGHDGGPCFAGANTCARRLDLVSPLTCQPNDVSEAQGRRKLRGRLCRRGSRPGRGPYHQEKSESKTRETVHNVTVFLRFAAGRHTVPARSSYIRGSARDVRKRLVHRRCVCRFLGRLAREPR